METKRICNFSKVETDTLMTLVKKYKDVVECKKSDTVKWKEKLKASEEITKEFNLILEQNPQRTSKNLRNKYENIKKTSKKKFAMEKREMGEALLHLLSLQKQIFK
ncbi:hypothetical protein JTB14_011404 [Gonioctena quinquepunctata]|nr:hypothetical protein JTB14_011404 [Gonioctena quinquepunctata]